MYVRAAVAEGGAWWSDGLSDRWAGGCSAGCGGGIGGGGVKLGLLLAAMVTAVHLLLAIAYRSLDPTLCVLREENMDIRVGSTNWR